MRVAVAVLLLACAPAEDEGGASAGLDCGARTGVVKRVIDGDTLVVTLDCQADSDCMGACLGGVCEDDERVRLVAVNAGETDKDECLAQAAKTRLDQLVVGRDVVLVYDPVSGCEDQHDRRLAYVRVDGALVQRTLVEEGLVCVWWFQEDDAVDYIFYESLEAAEDAAQSDGNGIWGQPRAQACGGKAFPSLCP